MNSLLSWQSQLAAEQNNLSGNLNCTDSTTDLAQPTWRDPQIHTATATGRSVSSHYDICDFVSQTVEEELVIGGHGDQQVVLKSGSRKPKLEGLTLSQWSIASGCSV